MATYATTSSLQTIMIGTSFDSATTSLCSKMLTHAENEINKYISKRYDISVFNTTTSIPPILTSLCETLTEGYMYQRMNRGDASGRGKELIDQAITNLMLIADYKLDLINSTGSVIDEMSAGGYQILSTSDGYSTTFDEDNELNWEVSPTKLDDISSGRN